MFTPAAGGWEDKEVNGPVSVEGQTGPLIRGVRKRTVSSQWSQPSQPGLGNLKDNAGRSFQGERILKVKESSQNLLLIEVLVGCISPELSSLSRKGKLHGALLRQEAT